MANLTEKLENLINQIELEEIEKIGILVITRAGATSMITSEYFTPAEFQEALSKTVATQQDMKNLLENLPC